MKKLGLIGCGNMGSAMARAAAAVCGGDMLLANRTPQKAQALAQQLGATVTDNAGVAAGARYILLAVKPQQMAGVLAELAPVLAARAAQPFVLVSMAAGLSCQRLRDMAGGDYPVMRIMPNTPAAIGRGVVTCCTLGVEQADKTELLALLGAAGMVDELDEGLMDAAAAVAGCGPAFVYLFIEAMADGGVAAGLPRQKALAYAAAAVEGAAALVRQSGSHPGLLKDAVCSPGGSTIAGVQALETGGLRGAVMQAVAAAADKNAALGRQTK